jgi:diadenosine tetraphosphatase ApaH/serine/threonine PP2A family protein phosphatase
VARAAAVWTLENLSVDNIRFIRELPAGPSFVDGIQVLHGSPCDEDDYLVGADQAAEAFNYLESRVAFFGHTHLQGGFIWNRERVETVPAISLRAERQSLEIDSSGGYLLNPGSVGQPRDGDPRAAYVLYDSRRGIVEYRRVDYDKETAQRKIREAGLPMFLAERLSIGR